MIRIEDFSKLSQVSIKTLRYFEGMGLFKPINDDRITGYRYYSTSQFSRLNSILALKDIGLSEEQIAQMLDEGVSNEQLRGMLRLKRAELLQIIDDEQVWLSKIKAQLDAIAMDEAISDYDVVIKQIEPQLVAGVRKILSSYPMIDRLFDELYGHLARFDVNEFAMVGATIWHDFEYKTSDIDGEAVVYLKQPIPEGRHVKVYELPTATIADVMHKGTFSTSKRAYEAIGYWIETNGYKIGGPNREIYLYCTQPVHLEDDSYVIEIQIPIAKIEQHNE